MSLDTIAALLDQCQLWRTTVQVAQQDVQDAEARCEACELRLREAKEAKRDVTERLAVVERELAEAVERYTAPAPVLYLTNK